MSRSIPHPGRPHAHQRITRRVLGGSLALLLSGGGGGCSDEPGVGTPGHMDGSADCCSDSDASAGGDASVEAAMPVPPVPIVDGGTGGSAQLRILSPKHPTEGKPLPVIVETANGEPLDGTVHLESAGVGVDIVLYRGRGSGAIQLGDAEAATLEATLGDWAGTRQVTSAQRAERALAGPLSGEDLTWTASTDIRINADVSVPAGSSLNVEADTRVLLAAGASVLVAGELIVQGIRQLPVHFGAADSAAWGGLSIEPGGHAELAHLWLTGAGGSGANFGHSDSAPVVRAVDATLNMHGGGILDCPGKAFGTERARVALEGVLLSRVDTGGEFTFSSLQLTDGHILEIPDGDDSFDDDDNDGIYLLRTLEEDGSALPSRIRGCVFANGEDDAIDHNGAVVDVRDTWIEGFRHEGIAASNEGSIHVRESVVRGCEQGIEAGYGMPEVLVEHCVVTDNDIGLRFGDSYTRDAIGHMQVRHTIVTGNREHNVRNFSLALDAPFAGGIEVECSAVDDPEFDGSAENVPGEVELLENACSASPHEATSSCNAEPIGLSRCP